MFKPSSSTYHSVGYPWSNVFVFMTIISEAEWKKKYNHVNVSEDIGQ